MIRVVFVVVLFCLYWSFMTNQVALSGADVRQNYLCPNRRTQRLGLWCQADSWTSRAAVLTGKATRLRIRRTVSQLSHFLVCNFGNILWSFWTSFSASVKVYYHNLSILLPYRKVKRIKLFYVYKKSFVGGKVVWNVGDCSRDYHHCDRNASPFFWCNGPKTLKIINDYHLSVHLPYSHNHANLSALISC